jgi:hypothetical protein
MVALGDTTPQVPLTVRCCPAEGADLYLRGTGGLLRKTSLSLEIHAGIALIQNSVPNTKRGSELMRGVAPRASTGTEWPD